MHELTKELEILLERIQAAIGQLDIDEAEKRSAELEQAMADPGFWNEPKAAAEKSKQLARLRKRIETWRGLEKDCQSTLELARLEDHGLLKELTVQYEDIKKRFEKREYELKLSGEYDGNDAIIHLHAGTGGTDAQDWTQMLERMYLRYAEKSGLEAEVMAESEGEEAGLKSAIIKLSGSYAFGRLRSEHGVHRLVRQSPFNSDNLRQTSFALVEVTPDIDEPEDVIIDDRDLRIDVYRSGGKGGQGVNTTDSAVRITHIPTNIVVAIQNERSQLQNKETAMKILRSRLAHLKHQQHADTLEELKGQSHTEQWGQQIRNYVLHPYTLVKDTRSGFETTHAEKVLDGDLDDFIDAYLATQIGEGESRK